MAAGQQQQSIDLSVLSLEQLNQMKTQHEEEVQTLSGNFIKLRDAQVSYSYPSFCRTQPLSLTRVDVDLDVDV